MNRRSRLAFLIFLLVLTAVLAAGIGVVRRFGPERLREAAEVSLSEALRSPIRVESARLRVGSDVQDLEFGLLIEAGGVEGWPSDSGPLLTVPRVNAQVDPVALVFGRIRLRSIELHNARLRVEHRGPGIWHPTFAEPQRNAESETESEAVGVENWLSQFERNTRQALHTPMASPAISLHNAHLSFIDTHPLGREGDRVAIAIEQLDARVNESVFQRETTLTATGRIVDGSEERGHFDITGLRRRRGSLQLALSLVAFDLNVLDPYLEAGTHPNAELRGTARGFLHATASPAGEWRGILRFDLDDFDAELPIERSKAPIVVKFPEASATAEVRVNANGLQLSRTQITTPDISLELEASLERPVSDLSRAEIRAHVEQFDLARAPRLYSWLPADARKPVESVLERFETGRLVDLEAAGKATLANWRSFLQSPISGKALENSGITAKLRDITVRVGDEAQLTNLRGSAAWSADRVSLRGVQANFAGEPLPKLDVTLRGFSHFLREDPRDGSPIDVAGLAGLEALQGVIASNPTEEAPGVWPKLQLELSWLAHPAFLMPLRNLSVTLSPTENGGDFALENARWGRIPITGSARYTGGATRRLVVALDAREARPRSPAFPAGKSWAVGRWALTEHAFGPWTSKNTHGALRAEGPNLYLEAVQLDLASGGELRGEATLDISHPGEVPFRSSLQLFDGHAGTTAGLIDLEPDEMTGTVNGSGVFLGTLRPNVDLLPDLAGEFYLSIRDGEIRGGIPAALAVADATDSRSEDERGLRYRHIETNMEIGAGRISSDSLAFDGPDLRFVASGEIDIANEPHDMQTVVGLFFFETLDKAIGKVPLLNNLLLGPDENLIGAYVELTGPWDDPKARLIPMKTVATGPASFAVEGFPRFVKRAIDAIQSALVSKPPPAGAGDPKGAGS